MGNIQMAYQDRLEGMQVLLRQDRTSFIVETTECILSTVIVPLAPVFPPGSIATNIVKKFGTSISTTPPGIEPSPLPRVSKTFWANWPSTPDFEEAGDLPLS
jgi:hypothetical protein